MKKLEDIKLRNKLVIKKAPDKFDYPDDIEEYIIPANSIELPFTDFFITSRKYNL